MPGKLLPIENVCFVEAAEAGLPGRGARPLRGPSSAFGRAQVARSSSDSEARAGPNLNAAMCSLRSIFFCSWP
eukprot:24056-Hanusia_phi.AAC.1